MEKLKAALNSAGINTATLAQLSEDGYAPNVYTLKTTGANAIPFWKQLRGLTETTGYWPILLGGAEDVEMHLESLEGAEDQTPAEIIQQGLEIHAQIWLAKKAARWKKDIKLVTSDHPYEWPEEDQSNHEFYIPYDYHNDPPTPKPEIMLALIPTRFSWEVAAYLAFGDFNDCPAPSEHVCLMKSWNERYGAEIIIITHNIIEMQVARPPKTQEEALALAMEQFLYCEDIVRQGMDTIERLAATLLNGTVWSFWWD